MLPASFARDGFVVQAKRKYRRVMIGTDGPSDSGKTEFVMSAPGPTINLCLDRGYEGAMDNQNPPPTRQTDILHVPFAVPLATQTSQPAYLEYWKSFYDRYKKALENPDARTIGIDGDSDSWELQRLAEFGRTSKVPSHLYDSVNAARRVMIARAYDSGKIVIATNKIRRNYQLVLDNKGEAVIDPASGRPKREWDGKSYERQGFGDQDYLWQIQLRHLYNPDKGEWGIRIQKCKPEPGLVGYELWGGDCTFMGLVQTVYPHVSLSEWGY